jgi:ribonuclease P/MRP protein subunit POP5
VSRAHYRLVWAALTFVTRLPRPIEHSCVIQVVRVSGTIRKAEEEAIRRAKAAILRATARERGTEMMLDKMLGGKGTGDKRSVATGIVSDDEDDHDDEDDMEED